MRHEIMEKNNINDNQENQRDESEQYWFDEYDKQLFAIRRSIRYHSSRVAFFERWSARASFFSVLTGSALVPLILSNDSKEVSIIFASCVAITQALVLIVQPYQQARRHSVLSVKFNHLEQNVLSLKDKDISEDSVKDLINKRLDIELDEPPVKRWLNIKSHNDLVRAEQGIDAEEYKIPFFQNLLIQWFDFVPLSKLKKVEKLKIESS